MAMQFADAERARIKCCDSAYHAGMKMDDYL